MLAQTPIDFKSIRIALVRRIQDVTGTTCILEEPNTQNSPRPNLPYFSFKMTTPAGKSGDDAQEYAGNGTTTIYNRGGQRRMIVSFHCYAEEKEQAFGLMALWQASLETVTTQQVLRRAGIAVWLNGSVQDLSSLLNTGFEARSQMDVNFGISSNITEDLGTIEEVAISGTVDSIAEDFTVEN